MLKLNLKTEPYWLDLPSKVRVKVRPISTAIMSAAWAETADQYRQLVASGNTDANDEKLRKGMVDSLLIKALAQLSIIEWEGVFNASGDGQAELNAESIAQLMDIWVVGREFFDTYTSQLKALEMEGNVSAPAASGTSAAEALTASSAT